MAIVGFCFFISSLHFVLLYFSFFIFPKIKILWKNLVVTGFALWYICMAGNEFIGSAFEQCSGKSCCGDNNKS